jgi:hydrogenase nickel incorporation protein HypA/HybF
MPRKQRASAGAVLEEAAARRCLVHELSLMEDLVATVASELGDRGEMRAHVVRLEVGRLACASPHALRFCFDVCVHGTALEGAALDIVETSGAELRLREVEVT